MAFRKKSLKYFEVFLFCSEAGQERMVKRLEMKLDVNREKLDKVRSVRKHGTYKTVKARFWP